MHASLMARMKELEEENRRLKAEILAEALAKSGKAISPARDGAVYSQGTWSEVRVTCAAFGVSERLLSPPAHVALRKRRNRRAPGSPGPQSALLGFGLR